MKEKTLIKILALVTLAFGVLAFAMMFFGAVTTGGENPVVYKGMELAFGKDLGKIDLWLAKGEGRIKFSFGVLLAYVLPLIAGLLLGFIDIFSKKKGPKFLFGVIVFAGFIFSIVLLLTVRNMGILEIKAAVLRNESVTTSNFADFDMETHLILAIVFAACAVCTSGSYTVLQLLKTSKK